MHVAILLLGLVFIVTTRTRSFRLVARPIRMRSSLLQATAVTSDTLGKVVVTGVGHSEEDEFLLSLLNEQELWSKIVLLTDDVQESRKRFLTRSARYSGLLNNLEFSDLKLNDSLLRKQFLADASAWLAFNVAEQDIVSFAAAGIAAGIKRAVFTTELPPERVNETSIPAFEAAVVAFHEAGGAFTGIRHGTVVAGSEDCPYEVVDSTHPCVESTVPGGVLARVVSEALRTNTTHHAVYGVSSSGAFAGAYLNILRASGLSRQQEVEKIFKGGIRRIAQLVQKAKDENSDATAAVESVEHGQDEEQETPKVHVASLTELPVKRLPGTSTVYDDHELDLTQSEEQQSDRDIFRIECRTQELLEDGFRLFCATNPHLVVNVTKHSFWKANEANTHEYAMAEVYEFREKVKLAQHKHQTAALGRKLGVADEERRQYAHLLTLKHRRTLLQAPTRGNKPAADAWVRYIYLLFQRVAGVCQQEGTSLEELQPHTQTLLLRCQANALRVQCGLQSSELLCDPRDAIEVVTRLTHDPTTRAQYGLQQSTTEIVAYMRRMYSEMLHTLPVLHLPAKILKDAISTLRDKTPITSIITTNTLLAAVTEMPPSSSSAAAAAAAAAAAVATTRYGDGLAALSGGPVLLRAEQIQFTAPESFV